MNLKYKYSLFAILALAVGPILAQSADESLRYLALGDSYTIGESVPEARRWPVQLAAALTARGVPVASPRIIATTGWRTDNLKQGIQAAQLQDEYDLVSLLIGVNNQYQGKPVDQYAAEYEELLAMAIGLAGGRKERVFVVSIPDYGYTPFGRSRREEISRALDEFNSINRRITEAHGVAYINITDLSRRGLDDPELVASDGLHPSGKQYALWVERMLKQLKLL